MSLLWSGIPSLIFPQSVKEPIMILDPARFERMLNRDDSSYPPSPYYPEERDDSPTLPSQDAKSTTTPRGIMKLWSSSTQMSDINLTLIKIVVCMVGSSAGISWTTGSWYQWLVAIPAVLLSCVLAQFLNSSDDR